MSQARPMIGLEKLRWEQSKSRLYWDFKGLLRAFSGKADSFGKCPACKQINFLFYVSTGDDEATICWPCWKK
jgi:hypothetical protein